MAMTIGMLSRRTGVPVKILRKYEDLGLIYTAGRSPSNYRLFDDDALWCVSAVVGLRGLGLTLAEIQELASAYLGASTEPIGPRFAGVLNAARRRAESRMAELAGLIARIDVFEAEHGDELTGMIALDSGDPRRAGA